MKEMYKKFQKLIGIHLSEVTFFDLNSENKKAIIKGAIRYANEDQKKLVDRSRRKLQIQAQKHQNIHKCRLSSLFTY